MNEQMIPITNDLIDDQIRELEKLRVTNCREFKTMRIGTMELDALVTVELKSGWTLHGTPWGENDEWFQALVRYGCETDEE